MQWFWCGKLMWNYVLCYTEMLKRFKATAKAFHRGQRLKWGINLRPHLVLHHFSGPNGQKKRTWWSWSRQQQEFIGNISERKKHPLVRKQHHTFTTWWCIFFAFNANKTSDELTCRTKAATTPRTAKSIIRPIQPRSMFLESRKRALLSFLAVWGGYLMLLMPSIFSFLIRQLRRWLSWSKVNLPW